MKNLLLHVPDSSVSVGVLDKELMEKELDCKFKCFVCRNHEAWLVKLAAKVGVFVLKKDLN